MPLPITQVQNNTHHRITLPNHRTTAVQPINEQDHPKRNSGNRRTTTLKIGHIVKHHVFPKHKFITRSDDLCFDGTTDGNSICSTYLEGLQLRGDDVDEARKRKAWDLAKDSIPMALNGQRNNTNKAIRDITFDSKQ